VQVWQTPHLRAASCWRSSRRSWRPLHLPVPPWYQHGWTPPRAPWRGVNALGRLLACAYVREVARLRQEYEVRRWFPSSVSRLSGCLLRFELRACGLLGHKARDVGWPPRTDGDVHDWMLEEVLQHCRRGRFGGYVAAANLLTLLCLSSGSYPATERGFQEETLLAKARRWGRFLDLLDYFKAHAPWEAMRQSRRLPVVLA
jgi:hypothetical protein